MEPQVAITLPILVGTDGVEKMSKSLDNYIGINESPREIFGKTLSIPDKLIYDYFLLTTDVSAAELEQIKAALEDGRTNPRDLKRRLARELVRLYHSAEAAQTAQEEFDRIFVKKDLPDEVPEMVVATDNGTIGIVDLLTSTKLVASKGEARRMIAQGAVSINGVRVPDEKAVVAIQGDVVVKVGKRKFLRVKRA
jgi:tyrosyl-tRNA synthetase